MPLRARAKTVANIPERWQQDFEESLEVLRTEPFGANNWEDIAEYVQEVLIARNELAGSEVLAWAERWQNPDDNDAATATAELEEAILSTIRQSGETKATPKRNRKIKSIMVNAADRTARACLSTIDWYHRASLRAKQGERAVARTKRIQIPDPVRRRIMARQGNKCMYCGIDLLRINRALRHIDHVIPVEHGGPNEESNYQALCNRYNSRKGGHQTDEEFRERYSELLRNTMPGRPPTRRIPYERFDAVTRRTRQLESTVARRKAIFKTPAQKITASSTVAGAVPAIVWFFAIPIAFPNGPAAGTVALFGAPIIFAAIWVASMWRAKVSGILDSQRT